jgi:hypothetical protein
MRKIFSFHLIRKSLFLLFTLILISFSVSAQKFVIAILPDTQREVNARPEMFMIQMQWLADKSDSLNIPIVLHVGDIVDFNNIVQYQKASEGFSILDRAKVSYAITLGNHDTDAVGENSGSAAPGNVNANLRTTDRFNSYLPVKRFDDQKGRFEKKKSDNAYYTFRQGGLKWLVLALEFCSRQEPVDWAGKIIADHPEYNVIILTHYHLNAKGEIAPDNAGYGDLSPKAIYDQMISQYPNVRLVLCGHTGSSVYRDDIGAEGNHIYQILTDYQGEDFGGAYIRLLEIDPDAGTISAKMYSPFYNITKNDKSMFSFSGVEFVPRRSKK